ncbi:amidohydrolase family protein [Reichenbachiella sp. MALMAid0571]
MKTSTQILLCFFLVLFSSFNSQPKEEKPICIFAGYMFDSEHKQLIKNQLIEVRDGKITKITSSVGLLKNKDIIDLSVYTVIPGLIDGHTHFLHSEEIGEKNGILKEILFESDAHRILRGAKFAKSWLMSGFTTVRDLGNSGRYLDIELLVSEKRFCLLRKFIKITPA